MNLVTKSLRITSAGENLTVPAGSFIKAMDSWDQDNIMPGLERMYCGLVQSQDLQVRLERLCFLLRRQRWTAVVKMIKWDPAVFDGDTYTQKEMH